MLLLKKLAFFAFAFFGYVRSEASIDDVSPLIAHIISYSRNDNNGLGYYFTLDQSDGQMRHEKGEIVNPGTKEESMVVTGMYSYIGSDGILNTVKYIADENGYRPVITHIPPKNMNTMADQKVRASTFINQAAVAAILGGGLGKIASTKKSMIPFSKTVLLAPVTRPDKIICVGMNYKKHCDELKIKYPVDPVIFSKFPSAIVGPFDPIKLPTISKSVDWEVELAVIIGKRAKDVDVKNAMDYVFGYTIAQDLSARDWLTENRNNGQYLLGKTMDTFCPLGPAVVCKDDIPDINNLKLKTWINGELMQEGNTSEMIFKIDFLVSYLSRFFTLRPGDVILTGTPKGVGLHRNPPVFLKKNDIVVTEIEGIGILRNVVV